MDDSYIAGFFDGEGSAMILTVRRKKEAGVFRFRPVVRISQGHREILDEICDYFGFGHVDSGTNRTFAYVCNGHDFVETFIKRIMPLAPIKGQMLALLQELIDFQRLRGGNMPYSREDIIEQLRIRDALFELNSHNRKNLIQKYPANVVLAEHRFVDLDDWNKERSQNGIKKLIEYAKSRRVKRIERFCQCGCGQVLITPDDRARPRCFIRGHNNPRKTEVIIT